MLLESLVAIVATLVSVAVGAEIQDCGNGGGRTFSKQCYTCPNFGYFNYGFLKWHNVAKACFGNNNDRIACTYYHGGFTFNILDPQYQKPQLIGRCYYNEDGTLKNSGEYAGKSSDECPSKAPRNEECGRELDQKDAKGTYFTKCDYAGCDFQTEACYACPKLKSDSAKVSTLNGELECGYVTGGQLKNTCRYDASNGKLLNTTSSDPKCPDMAPQDIVCARERPGRIAAAKVDAFIKEGLEKGQIIRKCEDVFAERRYKAARIACADPEGSSQRIQKAIDELENGRPISDPFVRFLSGSQYGYRPHGRKPVNELKAIVKVLEGAVKNDLGTFIITPQNQTLAVLPERSTEGDE
ncbi:hypothetical protein Hypma_003589 [Hypsizygus marmoreus]|uniref:Uncharacterized protein n=1 Tax=Hypsizygus marmoreus TaxID=39966 RepID=A0A369JAX8_HYPMA|nr:hypothetical protein Hypma_003589 [Hypsizygus marmoreus]